MSDIFNITGEDFFSPLTSKYKNIYYDCLTIIFECYRTELSYGVERDIIMQKLLYYFDDTDKLEVLSDGEEENLVDPRQKASYFLRQLKNSHWIETEIGSDQKPRIIMPGFAVEMMRTFERITGKKETEYQSEIASVYATLNNVDLMSDPYPNIIKPVYDHTVELFTALKQLNTNIKTYIESVTANKSAEEIIRNYLQYSEEIGSKAYHRLMTSENVSRFRNNILSKLDDIRFDNDIMEKVAWGYQKIAGGDDIELARDESRKMINSILDYYRSYDLIVNEITEKHTKYLSQTVKRAKFLLTNTNNVEGKINTILRYMAESCNRDEEENIDLDAPDEICELFNMFPQGFISEESIMTVPISRKITSVERVFDPTLVSEEEKRAVENRIYNKYKNRFSKKNISEFVLKELLLDRDAILASEINTETKRDMIRIAFISLYSRDPGVGYRIRQTDGIIQKNGFVFGDFEIRRK